MAAQFNNPTGIAVDGAGNLYVADTDNDVIRENRPGRRRDHAGRQVPGIAGGLWMGPLEPQPSSGIRT